MSKEPPPPPPGYGPPPAYSQGYSQGVVVQPMVPCMIFRELPVQIQCQHCGATITTGISYETGGLTWLIAGILLLMGLWLGCCLIPFCVDGCKDVIHTCPSCKQVVGRYQRL